MWQWTRQRLLATTPRSRSGQAARVWQQNGWSSPQMLARYGASARSARARRTYDRIMTGTP
jgi:integrase/recombinase XerD